MKKWILFIVTLFLVGTAFGAETKQIALLEAQAKKGDVDAQLELGEKYHYGLGVEQDYNKAAGWFHKAARQGLAGAQCYLGEINEKGLIYSVSYRRAVKWYRKAADQGYAQAQYCLGSIYERGVKEMKVHEKIITYQNDPENEKGNTYSGTMNPDTHKGYYIDQNYAEALKWYQKAALQGHPQAQIKQGVLCANGQGTEQNLIMAYMWFTIGGSDSETINTFKLIDRLREIMTPEQINEAERKAEYWLAHYKKNSS